MNLKKLFSKKKQSEPEEIYEELSDTEEPEAITDPKNIKEKIQSGTFIEPKVLIGVGLVLLFIISFVVATGLNGFDDGTQKKKKEEEKQKQTTQYKSGSLDELDKMPGTYSSLKDKNTLNKDPKDTDLNNRVNTIQNPRINSGGYDPSLLAATRMLPTASRTMLSLPMSTNPQLQAEKELAEAQKSGIRFAIESGMDAATKAVSNLLPTAAAATPAGNSDPKLQFLERNQNSTSFYLASSLQEPLTQYEIKAGTIIPGVLITGINSDLPGQLVAQVRENVYDSATGNYLLIPQGSKLVGTYDSQVEYGQSRVLVAWNRLILPDGSSLSLEGMVGADSAGYSGFSGRTNNHIPRILNGVILGSLLTASARIATGGTSDALSYSQLAGQGISENIAQSAAKITDKNMDVQPTIEIDPGYAFNVFVNKDIILQPYEQ